MVSTRYPEEFALIFAFRSKNFFFLSRTGKRVVSVEPTLFPEQYASIFVFLLQKFFFDISISGDRTSEKEVSTVPTWYPEKCASIFVNLKFYFDFSHRRKGGVSGTNAVL